MTDACGAWRGLLAAYALDQLDEAGRTSVEAHLEGCERCPSALAELAMPAHALAAATADGATRPAGSVPGPLGPAVMARVTAESSTRDRRRQRTIVLSSATVAALSLGLIASLALLRPAAHRSGQEIALSGRTGVVSRVVLDRRPWGTQLTVTAKGLTPGSVHAVWMSSADGHHTSAGTFTAVQDRRVRVVLAAAVPADQSVAVGISDPSGATVAEGRLH